MELVKILYNVETYRASMMEFEINLSELPLGNLSKSNIPKGLEPFNTVAYAPIVKGRPIVDASNIVFIVIPSIHPLVIKDEDDFKSKYFVEACAIVVSCLHKEYLRYVAEATGGAAVLAAIAVLMGHCKGKRVKEMD